MPVINGFDRLQIIRSDHCINNIPIIIYSTGVDEVVCDDAVKNGTIACLKK